MHLNSLKLSKMHLFNNKEKDISCNRLIKHLKN